MVPVSLPRSFAVALAIPLLLAPGGITPRDDEAPPRATTSLSGRITDANGNPIPGVEVTLYNGLATRWKGQSTTTDADGRYSFDPLETGSMTSAGYMPGMTLRHADFVSVDGQDWWDVEVPVESKTNRDFKMLRGGRVAGTLQIGGGEWALRNFDLRIQSSDERRAEYATTDKQGQFKTDAMFPGEYVVQWNEPFADYAEISRVKVRAGATSNFRAKVFVTVRTEVTQLGMSDSPH